MIVLGLDPGLAKGKMLGVAVIDTERIGQASPVLWFSREKLREGGEAGLLQTYQVLRQAIRTYEPKLLAVEDAGSRGRRATGALQAVVLVAGMVALQEGIPFVRVHPSSVVAGIGTLSVVARSGKKPSLVRAINLTLGTTFDAREHDPATGALIAYVGHGKHREAQMLKEAQLSG